MKPILLFLFLAASTSAAQINNAGSLTAYVDSLITEIPDATPSNLYQVPTGPQRSTWESVVDGLMEGNYASAHAAAGGIEYDVVQYFDTTNSTTYYILRKEAGGTNYWGTFILNPSPLRSRLFIQAPHPLHDANTGNQAIVVFKNSSSRAFILAGTHRCNSTALSSCDGSTSVCGGSSSFRKSDQAHNDDGTFQITTELLKRTTPNLVVIQLHGFVKDPGYPDLILGNGTQSVPANDLLVKLRNELAALDNTLTFKTAHVDTEWTTLTGTTNTQGRLINNSPSPCGTAAETPTGRFLHIEQAYTGLRDNNTNYAKIASAIANAFAPDKVIASAASGNWESGATWVGGTLPNDTTHVVISSGHTVTVTTAAAEGNSLSFGDNTASIALATGADLALHGDLSLATISHAAFSSWAADATLTFAGSNDQVLSGWNIDSTGFSTSLYSVIIDKTAGKVVTDGSDMNLNITSGLDIVSGTFELTSGDDIEGRTLAGAAATPAITVRSGASLIIRGDSSYIRSGTSDPTAIGLLRNFGAVSLYGTDLSLGYNFADIYNESDGTIEVFTGWKSSQLVRIDTLLIKAGSIFKTSTTNNLIPASGRTVLNAGGVYRIYGPSVNFSASFTNNGTVDYAASGAQTVSLRDYKKLVLSGSGTKTLTLTANRTSDTLELNGTASLTLTSASSFDFGINKKLSMAGGNINTNNDTLVLGLSGSPLASFSHTSGAVVGTVKRYFNAAVQSGVILPVGTASSYRPAEIAVTGAPATAGTIAASFVAADPGESGLPLNDGGTELTNVAGEGYWSMNTADGLSGGTYSLSLTASDFQGVFTVSTLRIVQRPASGSWSLQGTHIAGSGTVSAPLVSRSSLSSFAEFGIASGNDNPLPVELKSFTAAANEGQIELKWSTASEVNNHGFELQRSSVGTLQSDADHRHRNAETGSWTTVGFVDGNGTTSTPHEYRFADQIVDAGTYRYRLKQIDRDGNIWYSEVVEAAASLPLSLSLRQNFPNPFNPSTEVRFTVQRTGAVTLKAYDALGREAAVLVDDVREAGVLHRIIFDARSLAAGVYYLRLVSGGEIRFRKVLLLK